ncbi:membrane protein insertase YidC [Polynucleobacter sp. SHI8]|uniref:membrane protein insertase YidC n=1 Tax=unclassified Polynucleobacter TaxID=2640945 RepID=UPI002490565D|nr:MULTISPECIES: membrane protein insertase YidC [unclassified Polynucleobacter]BDW12361.1 membrane protein insertase YidC [Polynucleobacter sp. SHI2]BDW14809.1 membrane protein insertase YidC [Polynucleobacter sp. SHI8]
MDIRKTLLWVVFSVSGIMLFNNYQISNGQNPLPLFAPPQASNPNTANAPKQDSTNASLSAVPQVVDAKAKVLDAPTSPAEIAQNTPSKTLTLKNDLLEVEISTKGGTITHAILKKHTENKQPVVLFNTEKQSTYLARSGLTTVGLELPNHNDIFLEKVIQNEQQVIFSSTKNGVTLEKKYTLEPNSYVVKVENKITNQTANPISPFLYAELVKDSNVVVESQFYSTFTGPAIYTDKEKYKEVDFSDIEKKKVKLPQAQEAGESGWIAMVQHYFATAWIPNPESIREVYFDKLDNNLYRVGVKSALSAIAPGTSLSQETKLFVGPEEDALLHQVAPGFDLIKDYGYLTIIAKPLFWVLMQIHQVVQNWGWAIIILTIFIKIIFFPLSAASYKSMARMKEVQPRLLQMKEQYKNDPQKLNQAMMAMYKQEKINPLGGCLPVLIQIPVFISLYWVLLLSVEMRGAPWLGWIHDLSKPDTLLSDLVGLSIPIGILPIIMAVSMFIQTKLNPTPPDPIQAKVMLYMPLAFSLMFFFFPSGLVLYYIVNNVLSIAQQWQINKMFGTKKP